MADACSRRSNSSASQPWRQACAMDEREQSDPHRLESAAFEPVQAYRRPRQSLAQIHAMRRQGRRAPGSDERERGLRRSAPRPRRTGHSQC